MNAPLLAVFLFLIAFHLYQSTQDPFDPPRPAERMYLVFLACLTGVIGLLVLLMGLDVSS